jgi:hypothetical protein
MYIKISLTKCSLTGNATKKFESIYYAYYKYICENSVRTENLYMNLDIFLALKFFFKVMCVSIGCVEGPESEQEPQPTPHNMSVPDTASYIRG